MCKCEKAYCQYMSGPTEDAGTEALAIYLPVGADMFSICLFIRSFRLNNAMSGDSARLFCVMDPLLDVFG